LGSDPNRDQVVHDGSVSELWPTIVPLTIATALVPIQIVVTILLLRRSVLCALAWIGGMTAARLVQGVVFGFVLTSADTTDGDGSGPVVSTLLLVVGLLFLTKAVRTLFDGPDGDDDHEDDDAPPGWLDRIDRTGAGGAFLLGAGLMAVSVKFWAFTLNVIAAISAAEVEQGQAIAAFVAYVVLANVVSLVLLGVTVTAPAAAHRLLDGLSDWMTAHSRAIIIVVGLVFGTWFVAQALDGFGVI
jgi:hypothetical protein